MTKLALLILLVLSSNIIIAQNYQQVSNSKKAIKYYNKAELYYKNNNYPKAIEFLTKSLKYDDKFIEAWLLLGDSYTEVDSILEAIISYESAISIDSTFFPHVYYLLGNLNYKAGQYKESVYYYSLLKYPDVSQELLLIANERILISGIAANIKENPVSVLIENIGYPVNTKNDEYINYINSEKNDMLLTRRTKLPASFGVNHTYKEDLMYSNRNDSLWEKPTLVDLEWRDDLNMGSLNLSTDGRIMYFTGCYWPIGQGSCDLYASHKSGSHWLRPYNLGDNINTSSWESQPVVSSDSKKLFFASKRAGGKGGADIWMSVKLKNNEWSPPINLGDSINTPKDEMSPFLHADGNTLFFASNGHPGLGGYDLFVSRRDELGRWSLAKNIGYPTNSKDNEINIFTSIDGKQSWISSDRDGGNGGMDIYSFENYDDILPKKIMYVEGIIVDETTKKPLKAKIQITNLSTSEIINTTISDSITGIFLLVLFPGVDYAFNISKTGYLFLSENINLKDSIGINSVKKQFELSPFKAGNKLIMNNVFFRFNEHELLPASYVELDKLITLMQQNPEAEFEIIGHTDNIGNNNYNIELSINRAISVGNYLIKNGIDRSRFETIGMGASNPIADNISEQGRASNRRTEVRVK